MLSIDQWSYGDFYSGFSILDKNHSHIYYNASFKDRKLMLASSLMIVGFEHLTP